MICSSSGENAARWHSGWWAETFADTRSAMHLCVAPACRLLLSIRDSVQHVDYALARELAFQEGVRHAQLTASSRYSWFLSIASAAALASATTAYILTRRNALS